MLFEAEIRRIICGVHLSARP